jgi:PilZ domain
MSELSSDVKNRRHSLRRQPKVRVKMICRKGSHDFGANIAVALLDVSESGARLVVREELPAQQEVSISLEGPNHRRPVVRQGKVVWSVPAAESGHCVGVNFEKYLDYKDLFFLTNI